MNDHDKATARRSFRLMVHESNGSEFESLFSDIMDYYEEGFQQVKPYGNIGDRKNDGWIENSGTYFQVYSPEDVNKSMSKAVKKLKDDFKGLYNSWDYLRSINRFYFVLNDKFNGPPVTLVREIQDIKNKYELDDARIFTARDLEKRLFQLEDDIILSIVGSLGLSNNSSINNDIDFKYFQRFITNSRLSGVHYFLQVDTTVDGRFLDIYDAYEDLNNPTGIGYPFQNEKLNDLFMDFIDNYLVALEHIELNYKFHNVINKFRMIKGKKYSEEDEIIDQYIENKRKLFHSIKKLVSYSNQIFPNLKF